MEISLDDLWNHVLERLRLELAPPTFETWIKTAYAHPLENNCLVIYAPNPFARNWLQKYYIHTIANVVQDIVGYPVEIYITVVEDNQEKKVSHFDKAPLEQELLSINHILTNKAINTQKTSDLNPKYVFSRFVVGANNRMAHAAALAVAEYPGRDFNPLFLCGGVGLG